MPRITHIIVGVITIGLLSIQFMGCSSRLNLVKNGTYLAEGLKSDGIDVSSVSVYEDKGRLVVSGKLRRTNRHHSYPGHVDIAILAKDGSVLAKTSVKNKMPFIGRSKRRSSSFTAKFDILPPEGSTIQVAFHRKSSSNAAQFNCTENAAVDESDNQ